MGKLIAAGCTGALIAISAMLMTTAVAQAPKPNIAATSGLMIAASGAPIAWILDLDKRTVFSCQSANNNVSCTTTPGKIAP